MKHVKEVMAGRDAKGRDTVFTDVGDHSRCVGRASPEAIVKWNAAESRQELEAKRQQLVAMKQDIENEISQKYGRNAYAEAQLDIRERFSRYGEKDSIAAWFEKRTAMDSAKRILIDKKQGIERSIRAIKLALLTKKPDQVDERELLSSIVFELREIKELLRKKVRAQCCHSAGH